MSSTLLKSLKAYKCDVADCYESIYVVIANTAESNVRPLDYHHWAMCVQRNALSSHGDTV